MADKTTREERHAQLMASDSTGLSKSQKKKRRQLRAVAKKGHTFSRSKEVRKERNFAAHLRNLDRPANTFLHGARRPLSRLDVQARELGVYDAAYHCMNRKDRKRVVAEAHSKQQHAA